MRHIAFLAPALWILALAPPAAAQWQPLGLSGREINRLQIHAGHLYACTNGGLFRIPLAAPDTVWSPVGFVGQGVNDLAALPPDTLLAAKTLTGAPADSICLFRSTDGGATWAPYQNGFGAGSVREARRVLVPAGAPGTILAVGGRIEKSVDGGRSWKVVTEGIAVNALEQAPADPGLLWAGGETAIFWPFVLKSLDLGETWEQISLFAGGDNAVDAIAGHPTDPNVVFLGMEGRVMMSEDGGATWWNMTSPNPSIYTFGMAIRSMLPLKIYSAGASNVPDPRGLVFYRSYDGGLSWSAVSLPAYVGYGVRHLLPGTESPDGVLYLGTWNGVYRHVEIPVGAPAQEETPRVELRGRPNPFNHAVEFQFSLPGARRVSLLVVDVRGRLVATLIDGALDAGPHRVPWEAKGAAGGIYVCRLRVGDRVEAVKVLHLP